MPFTVSAGEVVESEPVSASSFTSTIASAATLPTRPVPGTSASTNAPSNASRTDARAEIGEIRSTRPRTSIEDVRPPPAPARRPGARSRPRAWRRSSPAAPAAPPRLRPATASAIRTESRRPPDSSTISASTSPSTSQAAPFTSRSSSRPSSTSAPARSSERLPRRARPAPWPAASPPPAGPCRAPRSSDGGGERAAPRLGRHSTSIRCASRATPSSVRLAAVAAARPFQRWSSSRPRRSGPPIARDPHDSRSRRAAVPPAGVCRKVSASAIRRKRRRPRPMARRTTRRSQDRRRAAGGCSSPPGGSPPGAWACHRQGYPLRPSGFPGRSHF